MSIKDFVKTLCPKPLLYILRMIKRHIISARILKYLPYYQDELSKELLNDQARHIITVDNSIFINRAAKLGWKYTKLAGFMMKGSFSEKKYSGYVILEHDDKGLVEYTKGLLTIYGLHDKFRVMKLKEFLSGAPVDASELVVASVKVDNYPLIEEYSVKNNVPYDIAKFIIGKHEEIQYLDVFSPVDDEVVIDAGCFDGMTALRFLNWGGSKIKHIYSFELDPNNFSVCEKNLSPYSDRVTLIKKGTWDKEGVMYLNSDSSGTSSSRASDTGTVKAFMTPIDDVIKDERVTFIKMDVEGAELKSLMGARNTIIKDHPRLAICAYHKREDLYQLPGYILSLVPEYKFLLRRYDSHSGETVLFAYCD